MRIWLALCFILLGFAPASAQVRPSPKVQATLIAEYETIRPGETVHVALELVMRRGWHTYWINPGDAGAPTELHWQLPAGWQSTALEWPYPERQPTGPLMDYGYQNKVWLLTTIRAPNAAKPGDIITLPATASWLVCKEVCIPEDAEMTLTLRVSSTPPVQNYQRSARFSEARAKIPQTSPWLSTYHSPTNQQLDLFIKAPELVTPAPANAYFFPLTEGLIDGPTPQSLGIAEDGLVLRMAPGRKFTWRAFRSTKPEITGVLVLTATNGTVQAVTLRASPGNIPSAHFQQPAQSNMTLIWAMGFVLLGGLILNLMPCVLPVLAMKSLAIAKASHLSRRNAIIEGLSYGAGVVLSVLSLGLLVISLRAGGQAVGWGFQLQDPLIVAAFALLIFAVALYMSGVYRLRGSFHAGDHLTRKSGPAGAFFTGILAVLVAAPCTAPFMAAALGYALTQSALAALLIFLCLGLGFAAPYVAITLSPRLLRLIPKPGPWMARFQQILAFPLYATVVWLIWVLSIQAGPTAVTSALAAMVLLAFAAWCWNASADSKGASLCIARAIVVIAALAALASLSLIKSNPTTVSTQINMSGPNSEPYSPARLDTLRAEQRPVFINATAAWCITCLVNERVAFSMLAVKDAFQKNNVAYLIADWTSRDPQITQLLAQYERSGVPLYLYFKPGADKPQILPQVLTPGMLVKTISP